MAQKKVIPRAGDGVKKGAITGGQEMKEVIVRGDLSGSGDHWGNLHVAEAAVLLKVRVAEVLDLGEVKLPNTDEALRWSI